MDHENIIYTKERDTGIATIIMNRPAPLNAYTQEMVEEMLTAIDDLEIDWVVADAFTIEAWGDPQDSACVVTQDICGSWMYDDLENDLVLD